MKLTARQKYDYRDLDRGEAQLIRIGHALWRDRRKLGDTVAEREGIYAALGSVWQAKREYRADLVKKRALRFSKFRDTPAIMERNWRQPSAVGMATETSIDVTERRGCRKLIASR